MTKRLKVAGILGGGAIMASMVVTDLSSNQTIQTLPTTAAIGRTITPVNNTETRTPTRIAPNLTPAAAPTPKPVASNCHPSYSGCLRINAGITIVLVVRGMVLTILDQCRYTVLIRMI